MSERSGGCLCGQVRFTLTAEPVTVRVCWCRDCQHLAANGTVNAIFPTAALHIHGRTAAYTRQADSGNQVTRRFCQTCGSQLFADSTGRAGLTVVRVGTLDEPDRCVPTANIWTGSAPVWACLDERLESVKRQPGALAAPPAR